MSFRVSLSETAVRQLRRLPKDAQGRMTKALQVLEEDPYRPRPRADIRPIEGTEPKKYRIRLGVYRAVYAVVGREVRVLEIFTRGRGYR